MAWRRTGDKSLSVPMMAWFTNAYKRYSASVMLSDDVLMKKERSATSLIFLIHLTVLYSSSCMKAPILLSFAPYNDPWYSAGAENTIQRFKFIVNIRICYDVLLVVTKQQPEPILMFVSIKHSEAYFSEVWLNAHIYHYGNGFQNVAFKWR